ncbi:MAG: hypothetical protein JNK85_00655 [Verrucomicrobiales bacterium]|nr:hypothetical protein [Verrucomicrobiales bacterium]
MTREAAMHRAVGWLVITPALLFCGAVLLGAAFRMRGPARVIADWVMTTSWGGTVYVFTVLGGLLWTLIRALSAEPDASVEAGDRRCLGWVAFGLLLVTIPLMLFQVLFIFAESD